MSSAAVEPLVYTLLSRSMYVNLCMASPSVSPAASRSGVAACVFADARGDDLS